MYGGKSAVIPMSYNINDSNYRSTMQSEKTIIGVDHLKSAIGYRQTGIWGDLSVPWYSWFNTKGFHYQYGCKWKIDNIFNNVCFINILICIPVDFYFFGLGYSGL